MATEHDRFCDLLLVNCWSESKQHKKAIAKRWGCEICNRWCDCDRLAAVRANEQAKIYSKVSKLELPSYLSNQLLRLDDVADLLRGGEQE